MKQLRLYQGYSSHQAKELYNDVLHDMKEYGVLYSGEDIRKFIESPLEIIKSKAIVVLDHTSGQTSSIPTGKMNSSAACLFSPMHISRRHFNVILRLLSSNAKEFINSLASTETKASPRLNISENRWLE